MPCPLPLTCQHSGTCPGILHACQLLSGEPSQAGGWLETEAAFLALKTASQPVMDVSRRIKSPASSLLLPRLLVPQQDRAAVVLGVSVLDSAPSTGLPTRSSILAHYRFFLGSCPKRGTCTPIFVSGLAFGGTQPKTATTPESGCIVPVQVTDTPT